MHDTMPVPAAQELPTIPAQMSVAELGQTADLIQQVIREQFLPDHHYGVIPGTEGRDGERGRPVLLKPGAEKLCMLFRLSPTFATRLQPVPGASSGHREVLATCTLTHQPTGRVIATGDGSCSTMESKYRWRNAKPKCPNCGAAAIHKSSQKREFFCWSKKGGCGATFPIQDQRIASQKAGLSENPDIADTWNTVLKMAHKRALVAAVLLATAASDAFVVEEEAEDEDDTPRQEPPTQEPQEPAQPKLSPIGELRQQVRGMVEALRAAGYSEEGITELMQGVGVKRPARFMDLTEADLRKVAPAFAAELKAGTPAGGS